MKQAERKFIVFASLVGVLMLTSALLLALAPAPLAPDATHSLLAVESSGAMDVVFNTSVQGRPDSWKFIYIHHSKTHGGNATSLGHPESGLGDHFLIGNGEGAADGEIQMSLRWDRQQPAAKPVGIARMDPQCITICVVGDFDRALPTPAQMRHLTQLVNALQLRMGISADRVLVENASDNPAAVGRYFPTAAFKQQVLP